MRTLRLRAFLSSGLVEADATAVGILVAAVTILAALFVGRRVLRRDRKAGR